VKPFVLVVSGWRDWPWELRSIIWTDLLRIRAGLPSGQLLIVRHGACRRGVDLIAHRFTVLHQQCEPEPFPARWYEHGPECGTDELREATRRNVRGAGAWCPGQPQRECGRAGDRRNRQMAYAQPRADRGLAYPGPPGKSGTRNAMRHLREAGIPITTKTFAEATRPTPTSAVQHRPNDHTTKE
jgi:hypothetical protein